MDAQPPSGPVIRHVRPTPGRGARHRQTRRWCALLLVAPLALGCADLTGSRSGDIRLVNATSRTLVYQAAELGTSNLLDINPQLSLASVADHVLAPGASLTVPARAIQGYPGAGASVRFFIYEVTGATATYRGSIAVSGRELAARGFRVEISDQALVSGG